LQARAQADSDAVRDLPASPRRRRGRDRRRPRGAGAAARRPDRHRLGVTGTWHPRSSESGPVRVTVTHGRVRSTNLNLNESARRLPGPAAESESDRHGTSTARRRRGRKKILLSPAAHGSESTSSDVGHLRRQYDVERPDLPVRRRHLDSCHPDIECRTFDIESNLRYRRPRYRMPI
jgi:hypothetical protein